LARSPYFTIYLLCSRRDVRRRCFLTFTLTSFFFVIFIYARRSPPKQTVVPVHAHNDYPTQAVQKTHDKPMPTHEVRQHTSMKPTIHQPRKWTRHRRRAHKTTRDWAQGRTSFDTRFRIFLIFFINIMNFITSILNPKGF